MLEKLLSRPKLILALILLFAFLTRVNQIWYPNKYVFDEVYHAFTAKEYLKGSKEAWEWWTTPPPGVAYEWTHPPVAKEIMAGSMWILHSTDAWAWRIPGVLMGVLAIFWVYLITKILFKREAIALIAAFIFSIDGLNFVQSRTGMNDIYVVAFTLLSLYLFLKHKYALAAIVYGLALASKWSAIYMIAIYLFLLIKDLNWRNPDKGPIIRLNDIKNICYFLSMPLVVYLISYLPFFWLGHTFSQFVQLQEQMWWYHTNLKAHHDYSSPWWSWPLSLYPVWYFVDYQGTKMANIFASGNPVVFSAGIMAVLIGLYQFLTKHTKALLIPLLCFFIFWLPWAFSPRIMFLYHYSPSVPFLSMILAYSLSPLITLKNRNTLIFILALFLGGFIAIYPWLIGIALPRNLDLLFFDFNLAKNPFG